MRHLFCPQHHGTRNQLQGGKNLQKSKTWKLNSMLPNNQLITEELKRRNQNVLGDKLKKKKKQQFELYVMQQKSFKKEVYS